MPRSMPHSLSSAARAPYFMLLAAVLALGACKSGNETGATETTAVETAAAALASDGSLTPDTSSDRCQLLPPENIAEYKRAHDLFNSAPGLTPQFNKGQLFKGGDTVSFKSTEAGSGPYGVDVSLLRDCSVVALGGFFLSETAPGELSGMILTSAAGSSYPPGTPGLMQITRTVVDSATMTGKTTIVAEYTIRLQEPAP